MKKTAIGFILWMVGVCGGAAAEQYRTQYFGELAKIGTAESAEYLPPLGGFHPNVERSRIPTNEGKTDEECHTN